MVQSSSRPHQQVENALLSTLHSMRRMSRGMKQDLAGQRATKV